MVVVAALLCVSERDRDREMGERETTEERDSRGERERDVGDH